MKNRSNKLSPIVIRVNDDDHHDHTIVQKIPIREIKTRTRSSQR